MIRVELSEAGVAELERVFREAADRRVRDRAQAVLMAHRGRPYKDIATDLGIDAGTLTRWLRAYAERGAAGLTPGKAKGASPKVPDRLAGEVKRLILGGPVAAGLDRANWTYAELADHLRKAEGINASRSAVVRFCRKHGVRVYRPTYRHLRGKRDKQASAAGDLDGFKSKADEGEIVLLSQDEARFPMVPTATATLGVKGHRPEVGTWDNKGVLYAFAVVNVMTAAVHVNTLEVEAGAKRKTGVSKTGRMQAAFAAHLRHVGRVYPREKHPRVVLIIDNAPWHRGKVVDEALRENPHLEFYRLPSYSPHLNPVERFWRKLRRRATHNRLFETLADLKSSVRNSIRYFQTVRSKVASMLTNPWPVKPAPSLAA